MNNIILYTTHCPKCLVLSKKLDQKNISYTENENIDEIQSLGIMTLPILKVNEDLFQFGEAIKWVNEQEGN